VTGRPVVQTVQLVPIVKVRTNYVLNRYRKYQYVLLSHISNKLPYPDHYPQRPLLLLGLPLAEWFDDPLPVMKLCTGNTLCRLRFLPSTLVWMIVPQQRHSHHSFRGVKEGNLNLDTPAKSQIKLLNYS